MSSGTRASRRWPPAGVALALAVGLAATSLAAPQPSRQAIIANALQDAEQRLAAALPQLPTSAARAEAIGQLAMLYHAQTRLPEAIAAYRRALASHSAAQWHYLLGAALAEAGDMEAATAAYRQAALLAPNDGFAHYRLGAALLLRGDTQAATTALRRAAAALPEQPAVLAALGEAAAAAGDLAAARAHLERAATLAPTAGRVAYRLGVVYRDLGQLAESERWFKRRNDFSPALADPRLLAVAERSLSPKFFLAAGNRAKARGDWPEALAAFARASALAPADVAAGLARADALHALGRTAQALAATDDVLAHSPEAADAWLLRAFLLHRSDRVAEAIGAAERGARLRGGRAGRTLLAALRMRGGRFRAAAADYRQLAAEFPQAAYFHYWLALARFGAGACDAGREALAAALRLQPNWGQAHIALGRATALCGDASELATARQRAAQLVAAADNVDTRLTAAYLDLRQGRTEAARQSAVAALPHPDARLLLAALDRKALPATPFAPGSGWWLPPELAAAPPGARPATAKAAVAAQD